MLASISHSLSRLGKLPYHSFSEKLFQCFEMIHKPTVFVLWKLSSIKWFIFYQYSVVPWWGFILNEIFVLYYLSMNRFLWSDICRYRKMYRLNTNKIYWLYNIILDLWDNRKDVYIFHHWYIRSVWIAVYVKENYTWYLCCDLKYIKNVENWRKIKATGVRPIEIVCQCQQKKRISDPQRRILIDGLMTVLNILLSYMMRIYVYNLKIPQRNCPLNVVINKIHIFGNMNIFKVKGEFFM